MKAKFRINDRVQLITGSNTMTIVGHAKTHTVEGDKVITDKYECAWFDGIKSQKAVFSEVQIKLIERHA